MATATQHPADFKTLLLNPGEDSLFRDNYNKRPFLLQHKLAGHPLVQLPHLTQLAQSLAKTNPGRLYYDVGRAITDRGWDYQTERPFSAEEAVQRIETADAWMILKGIQILPEYGELMNLILREIHGLSGRDLDKTTKSRNISLIITSPNRITPYHMDQDCNYLLQMRGTKTAYVFNGADRSVVTAEELERFYAGEINAAEYREATQAVAWKFELKPGLGVHVPVVFPHWVQNDNNVSISVSINFVFIDRTAADVHRINHYLRRLRITPRPPGQSAVIDGGKSLALTMMKRAMGRNAN